MKKADIIFKVIVVGNGAVGKTSLLNRFLFNHFDINSKLTIGVNILSYDMVRENQNFTFQIWDFGGQDRFRYLQKGFTSGADAVIMVFDLYSAKSFNDIPFWFDFIDYVGTTNTHKPHSLLIGTKSDLKDITNPNLRVKQEEINKIKKKYNCHGYFNTSAKTGENIRESMMFLFNLLIEKTLPKFAKEKPIL